MDHTPVLVREVLEILRPAPAEVILDCTVGLGGHAVAFLTAVAPRGRLIGLDADAGNLREAERRLHDFGARVELHHGDFRDVVRLITTPVDVVFADLGLSSPHVDDPSRGFTFRTSAPLDLRYNRSRGDTAADLLLQSSEERIAEILRECGELPRSRQLARALHQHFRSPERPADAWTTRDVVACVTQVFAFRAPRVLPQVFQALRIAVNDELGALRSLLTALPEVLRPGGRCGIISYHSLEDRIVKQAFRALSTPERDQRTGQSLHEPSWELLTRAVITPSVQELSTNPRSRSARFRAIRLRSPSLRSGATSPR